MSEQHGQRQQHQPINNVHCCKCGDRHFVASGEALPDALNNGWTHKNNQTFCKSCSNPMRIFNIPYSKKDDRLNISENGTFLNQKNEDGTISIWKLVFGPPPSWILHKIEQF